MRGRQRRVRERGEANMKAKIYKFSIENLIFSYMKLKVSQQTFKNTLLSTPFFSILLAVSPSNLHLSIVKVTQSCPTLCDPMDYTVQGILQARILEWITFPFSRRSSQPRDWTQVSHIAGGFFTSWATRETHLSIEPCLYSKLIQLCSPNTYLIQQWSPLFCIRITWVVFIESPISDQLNLWVGSE